MKYVVYLIVAPITSFVMSVIWFRLWFYDGWFGTPKILHKLFWADGERSFDFTLIEMLIIVFVLVYVVTFASHKFIFRRKHS